MATNVSSWKDLHDMRDDLDGDYVLTTSLDKDSTGYDTYAGSLADSGAGWEPVSNAGATFGGTFDGAGYTIGDLYINRTGTDYVGLIGNLWGIVKNIGLLRVDIHGGGVVGALVGFNNIGTIEKTYSTGDVEGETDYVGGLVGGNESSLTKSFSLANVIGRYYVGGLVGRNRWDTIQNTYAGGRVSARNIAGGLAGSNSNSGIIDDSYAFGSVMLEPTFTTEGGIVGDNTATVTNCFYDEDTTGQSDTGKGTPKTTAQMKDYDTFNDAEWSIALMGVHTTEAWYIDDGNNYPRLGWEPKPPGYIIRSTSGFLLTKDGILLTKLP